MLLSLLALARAPKRLGKRDLSLYIDSRGYWWTDLVYGVRVHGHYEHHPHPSATMLSASSVEYAQRSIDAVFGIVQHRGFQPLRLRNVHGFVLGGVEQCPPLIRAIIQWEVGENSRVQPG